MKKMKRCLFNATLLGTILFAQLARASETIKLLVDFEISQCIDDAGCDNPVGSPIPVDITLSCLPNVLNYCVGSWVNYATRDEQDFYADITIVKSSGFYIMDTTMGPAIRTPWQFVFNRHFLERGVLKDAFFLQGPNLGVSEKNETLMPTLFVAPR